MRVGCTSHYVLPTLTRLIVAPGFLGGVKINALPEEAYAVVNHRISTDSSVGALKDTITSLFTSFTADRKLSLNAFGKDVHISSSSGLIPIANVTISEAFGSALQPAPVTPTGTQAWHLLSGTIRSAYHDAAGERKDVVVTPMTLGGNTGELPLGIIQGTLSTKDSPFHRYKVLLGPIPEYLPLYSYWDASY